MPDANEAAAPVHDERVSGLQDDSAPRLVAFLRRVGVPHDGLIVMTLGRREPRGPGGRVYEGSIPAPHPRGDASLPSA